MGPCWNKSKKRSSRKLTQTIHLPRLPFSSVTPGASFVHRRSIRHPTTSTRASTTVAVIASARTRRIAFIARTSIDFIIATIAFNTAIAASPATTSTVVAFRSTTRRTLICQRVIAFRGSGVLFRQDGRRRRRSHCRRRTLMGKRFRNTVTCNWHLVLPEECDRVCFDDGRSRRSVDVTRRASSAYDRRKVPVVDFYVLLLLQGMMPDATVAVGLYRDQRGTGLCTDHNHFTTCSTTTSTEKTCSITCNVTSGTDTSSVQTVFTTRFC